MGTMWLPPIPPATEPVQLENVSSVVLVGANGCGKSQMGVWIDGLNKVVHRVSAQRALTFGDYIQPRPLEQVSRMLVFGSDQPNVQYRQKVSRRWQNNPIGLTLNDFELVLAWLFAEHSKTAIDFRETFKNVRDSSLDPGESKQETALNIWQSVMRQRRLVMEDNKVTGQVEGGEAYAARGMSDGERVAIYLIGQCLAVPNNAIIVIDEPEIHLHQAIQARLWDQVEAARPDCVFVYITHDLNFAASRASAKKIWVKSYDGKQHWEWEEVQTQDHFPESLVLRILGSRRPVLFVEGDVNSLDVAIYRTLFPERFVIPRGSCESVIQSTKAVRSLQQLHHADAYGIIDRDHRTEQEVKSYAKDGVFAPVLAEIENLLIVPKAIRLVSKHLKRNSIEDLKAAQDFLLKALEDELKTQINDRSTFQIQQKLNSFPGVQDKKDSGEEFKMAVNEYLAPIDPALIFAESEHLFNGIVDRRDYPLLLKHFNRKSLASRISRNLGLRDGEYTQLVLRLLQGDGVEGERLRKTLRCRLPKIPASNET